MDLLPFAREFVFPQLGVISKNSDGNWVVWKLMTDADGGLRLIQSEGKMARYSSPELAHAALMQSDLLLGSHLSLVHKEELP